MVDVHKGGKATLSLNVVCTVHSICIFLGKGGEGGGEGLRHVSFQYNVMESNLCHHRAKYIARLVNLCNF